MTFEQLAEQYKPLIKGFSYKYKVNGYTREDVEQELLMVLHKCMQNFDETKKTKFITYFQNSCYYHMIKLRKKNQNYELIIDNVLSIPDEELKTVYNNIEDEYLLDSLNKVKYGEYLKMYYLYGISIPKIAKTEGVSKQAIHQFIKKGLENMKKLLDY